jgi:hypothetical protein
MIEGVFKKGAIVLGRGLLLATILDKASSAKTDHPGPKKTHGCEQTPKIIYPQRLQAKSDSKDGYGGQTASSIRNSFG